MLFDNGKKIVGALLTSLVLLQASISFGGPSASFADIEVRVPFAMPAGAQRVAADLDGDGQDELVVASRTESNNFMLHLLDWQAGVGYRELWGTMGAGGYTLGTELIVYQRVDQSGAEGVALAGSDALRMTGGERFEGLPLRSVGHLPAFKLERVVALGDFDGNGVLGAITASAAGFSHWNIDSSLPTLEVAASQCIDPQSFPPNTCVDGQLAQVDGDAQPELVLQSSTHLVLLDTADLSVQRAYPGGFGAHATGNVDGDAAAEIIVGGNDRVLVFDAQSDIALAQFPLAACFCGSRQIILGTSLSDPARVDLYYSTHMNSGVRRLALPSGAVLPDPPGHDGVGSIQAAVDLDGDGQLEPLVSVGSIPPSMELRALNPLTLRHSWRSLPQYSSVRRALKWQRPTGTELVMENGYSTEGRIAAANYQTGTIAWHFPGIGQNGMRPVYAMRTGHANLDAVADLIVLTDSDVMAFSGIDRALLWRHSTMSGPGTLSGLDNFLPHDLDGDGRDELLMAGRNQVLQVRAALDFNLLWEVPPSMGVVGSVMQMRLAQFDNDAALELEIAGTQQLVLVDLQSRLPLASTYVGFDAYGIPLAAYRNGSLELHTAWQWAQQRVYALPGMTLQRAAPLVGVNIRQMSIDPLGAVIVGAATDGRLLAYDADTLQVLDMTQDFGHFGAYQVTAMADASTLHLEGGGDFAWLDIALTVDRSLFRDSFEGAAP